MVSIWELSASEPIEDVSKITFILSKSRGRAALRDKLTQRVRNIAEKLLTGYVTGGIKRARTICGVCKGTGEPRTRCKARMPKVL